MACALIGTNCNNLASLRRGNHGVATATRSAVAPRDKNSHNADEIVNLLRFGVEGGGVCLFFFFFFFFLLSGYISGTNWYAKRH